MPENSHYNRLFCNKTCRNRYERAHNPNMDKQAEEGRFRKKLKDGEILPPNEPSFYENYKEPLKKVDKGFGFYGVIAMNEEKTHVQCHECGYYYKSLNGHTKKHKLSIDEYKDKYQLLRKSALVGEELREKRIEIYKNRKDVFKQNQKTIFKKHNEKVRAGKASVGRKKYSSWTLERRNKEGLCPDQLLETIRKQADDIGRTPTADEHRKYYGGRYTTAIITMYKTWNNAVKMSDLEPRPSGGRFKYKDSELIEYLVMFYEQNGRVAVNSDFSRGYLPPQSVFINRFGSLNEARRLAGIPILVPLGGRRWVEVQPEEYMVGATV